MKIFRKLGEIFETSVLCLCIYRIQRRKDKLIDRFDKNKIHINM
ncbi:hypothetical protein HMPREF0220_0249 [Clostridioides difficile NAP08]|uniref:Uncharacterized protein n=1 Tax=Clostridioides difficile NAP08 TaxID=525259 RepID=D5Q017_CLODI|nr:hypothetical protein HMPREF0220_0249 [Clostridioides difficile NAP08]EFH13992.1 hypothetical protein HMPREF0219_3277 [Clostridioides difficile NAP07]